MVCMGLCLVVLNMLIKKVYERNVRKTGFKRLKDWRRGIPEEQEERKRIRPQSQTLCSTKSPSIC